MALQGHAPDEKSADGSVVVDAATTRFRLRPAEYKQGVGRPPTLEELAELLRLVLSGADTSMIQDLEKRNVSGQTLDQSSAEEARLGNRRLVRRSVTRRHVRFR
jgi:hypothetical protein